MASFLARLGRFSYRRRGRVLLAWLVAFMGLAAGAAIMSEPTSDAFSIPGTESQRAFDLLKERMPEAGADNASARIVFSAAGTASLGEPAARAAIEAAVAAIGGQPKVAMVTSPFATGAISPDGRTALANVAYAMPSAELTEEDRDLLADALAPVEDAGVAVEIGGSAATGQPEPGGLSEAIGLLVAAVTLTVTFGAMVAAGLPLLTAVVGVAFGLVGIQIATGFFELSSVTMTLATMLGLAVGIDYALFIVSRYRHELIVRRDGLQAIGLAVGTAGSAVVFAGLTVTVALVALVVVGIPFLSAMAIAAAATVMLAVAVALTLLPALLGFAGPRILGRRGFTTHDIENVTTLSSLGQRWVAFVIRRRGLVATGAVAVLAAIAVPAVDLRLGLPSEATKPESMSPRRAYDQVTAGFGPGRNGPLLVTADVAAASDRSAAVAAITADLARIDGVAAVAPAVTNRAGDLAIVTVIPATGPSDEATETLVHEIRSRAGAWQSSTAAAVSVTGETAVAIDISKRLADTLVPYLTVIMGLAFVLLTLVFRSLVVPLKATLGFLLSVAAAFGAVVAVFQWGWLADLLGVETTGPIVSFLPIMLIGLLFGLAMDYEVFLVTRMREAFVHGDRPDAAIRDGFRHGARVVTAAAVIMVGVFSGFILADDPMIQSMGFALAVGVSLDAFVVRMTIVPAVMSLLGARAWSLPAWLDRILPNIDIEGAGLDRGAVTPPSGSDSSKDDPERKGQSASAA